MTTDQLIQAFLELGSPFIADGSQKAGLPRRIADPALRPLFPERRIAGTVVTFRMRFHPSPQPAMAYSFDRAFAYARTVPSPILVAESGLGIRSPFGGGASRTFVHANLAGSIIDGTIRDVADVRAQGYQMFSRGISTDSFVIERLPEGYVGADTGSPVTVGGVTVVEGDLVVADEDGIVFCRPEDASAAIDAAREILVEEEEIFKRWDAGESYLGGLGLER
jgi:4-hydroxy-4-methyl-2-oxoglutarate aldolase